MGECLSRMEAKGLAVMEVVYSANPEFRHELAARVGLLRDAGLMASSGSEGDADELDLPEQLGEFHLLSRMGAGGMGVVYKAEQTSLGRIVALKLIRPEQRYFPGARKRFAREVEAVARLAHPSIAPVFNGN
ncbi:MAG: serine/threonine protein kinase [Planctomycetota bacterium]|jgi:serine/threonine protein kinase